MNPLAAYLPEIDERIRTAPGAGHPLSEPMAYALSGGKRLRPALLLASARACGGDWHAFLDAAAAIQCVHAYSLVHDDLPAMDDDDLRHGRPTVHRAFGEATAILVGDGLLTLAFGMLAAPPGDANPERRLQAIRELAHGAGIGDGMVGGQALDLIGAADPAGALSVGAAKTGALMGAACGVGAALAGAASELVDDLRAFGQELGQAFQIKDDLLDIVGVASTVGKRTQKDAEKSRPNFARLAGVQAAESELADASERARVRLRAARTQGCDISELLAVVDALATRES